MLFYEGTKQSGYIQPRKLAQYDIVITTYSVLQSETNYVDLPHSNSAEGRRFRNPKRFMAIAAPLPCVQGRGDITSSGTDGRIQGEGGGRMVENVHAYLQK